MGLSHTTMTNYPRACLTLLLDHGSSSSISRLEGVVMHVPTSTDVNDVLQHKWYSKVSATTSE